jgi:putative copper resistance protein D
LAAGIAASLAWAGHAAATEGLDGAIHPASDALHLIAAGAWLGALWPLAVLLGRAHLAGDLASAAIANEATRRFSILGMISIATILATSVVNTYQILGIMAFSIGTDYNRLLLAKIGLFIALLAIAAVNRRQLRPQLSNGRNYRRAIRQLQWNSLAEVGLGLLVLAIVSVLGRVPPHAHGMPSEPSPQTDGQNHMQQYCGLSPRASTHGLAARGKACSPSRRRPAH